jgi:hypothetical protein
MTYTYDLTSPIGLVRLLIPDRNQTTALFTDEEISALINIDPSRHVKRAAALALEAIASDRAMVLQVITTNGLSTNGATLSRAMCERAAALRTQADNEEAAAGGAFDWAEMVTGNFAYKERMWAEIMRTEGGTQP